MVKTHSETFTVRSCECDLYGRMRLDALFVAMQEGGERHALQMGVGHSQMLERGLFFALTRIHVVTQRAPRLGERVVHTTWPSVSNRFFFPRYHVFTLEDGTPLATAGALWVLLDMNERRIVSPLTVDLDFPDNSDIPVPINANARLNMLTTEPRQFTRSSVYSEFDINGHVNNTKYIAWLCDAIGKEALDASYIGDLVVNYEKEIREETALNLEIAREGDLFSFKVLAPDGDKHFVASGILRREEPVHE